MVDGAAALRPARAGERSLKPPVPPSLDAAAWPAARVPPTNLFGYSARNPRCIRTRRTRAEPETCVCPPPTPCVLSTCVMPPSGSIDTPQYYRHTAVLVHTAVRLYYTLYTAKVLYRLS